MTVLTLAEGLVALGNGATLVTASRRLSRGLLEAYDSFAGDRGLDVWQSPDILPWHAWLARSWDTLSGSLAGRGEVPPLLLSSSQQRLIWEEVIESVHKGQDLVEARATAPGAANAWNLLHGWLGALSDGEWEATADTRAFFAWQRLYRKQLGQHNWIDNALLPDRLRTADAHLWIDCGRPLLLAGFEEYTPQQRRLLDALEKAGATIHQVHQPQGLQPAYERIAACANKDAEIRSAAEWAASLLRERASSIAIVVPGLEGERSRVERIFTEVLHPDFYRDPGTPRRFNLSLGLPLSSYPVVTAALSALECVRPRVRLEDAGCLLRSPFFAGGLSNASSRAIADSRLRELGAVEIAFERFCEAVACRCPDLAESLRGIPPPPSQTGPSGWARYFSMVLEALGWPGERSRSSAEFQTLTRWQALLGEFAGLEIVRPSMTAAVALECLREMASADVYQPRSAPAPVQILGLLETSGLRFDHLWIMGLSDETWPLPPSPSPFLPASLQRRFGMPHATSERELEFARETTARLRSSARSLTWSYPRQEQDTPLRPSAMLPPCRREDVAPEKPTRAEKLVGERRPLDQVADEGVPAPAGVRGGSGILRDFSDCQFKAYARYRLRARALPVARPGLDPMARGQVAHAALCYLWGELKSSQALAAPDLTLPVRRAVTAALDKKATESAALAPRFRALEQERLEKLLLDWLDIERQRGPFEVVELEQAKPVKVGPLEIEVRLDRSDRLPDGRNVLLDYKTGKSTTADWIGDRPGQPQLPIYATTHDGELAAIAFAQLATGDLGFKGLASQAGILPGTSQPGDLQVMVEEWRVTLANLAQGYADGKAAHDPKKGDQTCRNCDLHALCRVREPDPESAVEEGPEEHDDD